MRRVTAILFLCVLLFNFYGYRLMIDYWQYQHASLLDAQLDEEQYSDEDLLSIKTPLHLPYYNATNSTSFERVHGSIEIEGVTYEYVKRRVYRDTLELLCLPNKVKMHLQSAAVEFFKRSLQGTPGEKQPTIVKIALPDYCQELPLFSLAVLAPIPAKHFLSYTTLLSAGYLARGEHPPESMPFVC